MELETLAKITLILFSICNVVMVICVIVPMGIDYWVKCLSKFRRKVQG